MNVKLPKSPKDVCFISILGEKKLLCINCKSSTLCICGFCEKCKRKLEMPDTYLYAELWRYDD